MLDHFLPYLMNRLVARLNQNLGERLRRRGYSFAEWRVLAALAARDGMTLSEIAEAAIQPQPTVSRLAAQLTRRGFVERRASPRDSRFVHVFLTPRGRAAYRRMLPEAVAEYRAAVRGFDVAETEAIRRALERMVANMGLAFWSTPRK
jgi:DNA-binding MarR family transcriptional regulator